MKDLTWPQARALARAGSVVRRREWRKWLFFQQYLYSVVEGFARRVALAGDFARPEFLASDWTDEPWPGGPPGGTVPGVPRMVATLAREGPAVEVAPGSALRMCRMTLTVTIVGGPAGFHPLSADVHGIFVAPGFLPFAGYRLFDNAALGGGGGIAGYHHTTPIGWWLDRPGAVMQAGVRYTTGPSQYFHASAFHTF